jgi:hypothetical protein
VSKTRLSISAWIAALILLAISWNIRQVERAPVIQAHDPLVVD